jgi:hypothetical protein
VSAPELGPLTPEGQRLLVELAAVSRKHGLSEHETMQAIAVLAAISYLADEVTKPEAVSHFALTFDAVGMAGPIAGLDS